MNLFGQKKPKLEAPMRMPDSEDKAVIAARKKRLEQDRLRGGRESTILSDNLIGATGKLGQ